jgi:hypothetical protein
MTPAALAALRACLSDNGGQLLGESSGPAGVFEQWQFSDYNTVIIELTPPGYRTLPLAELAKIPMRIKRREPPTLEERDLERFRVSLQIVAMLADASPYTIGFLRAGKELLDWTIEDLERRAANEGKKTMNPSTLKIEEVTDEEDARKSGLVPIPMGQVAVVKRMSFADRKAWLKKQRRAAKKARTT